LAHAAAAAPETHIPYHFAERIFDPRADLECAMLDAIA
jgi:hypothetical protein